MSIQGVTFDLQPLTAAFDGALHAYLLTDGVLRGCEVTYSGYDVYVSPGQFIAAGRLVHIPERTRIFGSSIFESASIQIKFTIDLNNTASAAEFTQGRFASAWVSTSSGDTFPALVQEDINVSTGRKYEVEFARATTDASRLLTSATRTLRAADLRLAASGGGGTGADGRTPELRLGKTAIEWRYVGDAAWQTLVPLADITGPQGRRGHVEQRGRQAHKAPLVRVYLLVVQQVRYWLSGLALIMTLTGPLQQAEAAELQTRTPVRMRQVAVTQSRRH